MNISDRTLKLLWAKSGGKCSFPGCDNDLISEDGSIIGECCHIVARKKEGARGKELLTVSQREEEENLILLCRNHHKIIDDFPEKYTVDVLKQYKKEQEEKIRIRLSRGKPWNVNFSQIYYMNLRRIEMLAIQEGFLIDCNLKNNDCLFNLGVKLSSFMSQIKNLMETLQIHASDLIEDWDNLKVGQFVSIHGNFYTKNVPSPTDIQKQKYHPTGDLKTDAHLHQRYREKKCILTLSPKYLTTSTAFVNFKSGKVTVEGLGLITSIEEDKIIITPYILGTPKTFYDFFHTTARSIEL